MGLTPFDEWKGCLYIRRIGGVNCCGGPDGLHKRCSVQGCSISFRHCPVQPASRPPDSRLSDGKMEVHPTRKLADVRRNGRREKPLWVQMMSARRRKNLVVCHVT